MFKKKLVTIIVLVVLNVTVMAQEKASLKDLAGVWSIFSMDVPGEMYFNFKTDSVFIKAEEGEDSTMVEFKKGMMLEAFKGQVDKMSFTFDAYGNVFEGIEGGIESKKLGQYDVTKAAMVVKEKESGESTEVKILLKDNILTMLTDEDGVTVTIRCTRKEK